MARSARDVMLHLRDDARAKKSANENPQLKWMGSGVWEGSANERLLLSLEAAYDLLEDACYGVDDPGFLAKLDRWAKLEWGGYLDRATFMRKEAADAPAT